MVLSLRTTQEYRTASLSPTSLTLGFSLTKRGNLASTHIRIDTNVKEQLEELAEAWECSVGDAVGNALIRLGELESKPRYPLNATPSDFKDVHSFPLIAWRNGALHVCPHGCLCIIDSAGGRHWYANDGHECSFTPRC